MLFIGCFFNFGVDRHSGSWNRFSVPLLWEKKNAFEVVCVPSLARFDSIWKEEKFIIFRTLGWQHKSRMEVCYVFHLLLVFYLHWGGGGSSFTPLNFRMVMWIRKSQQGLHRHQGQVVNEWFFIFYFFNFYFGWTMNLSCRLTESAL